MFGINQAECCAGESGDCIATSTAAAGPGLGVEPRRQTETDDGSSSD